MKENNPREKIAKGVCVSPLTVDRCPYCVDTCEAAHWKNHIGETLNERNIKSEQ